LRKPSVAASAATLGWLMNPFQGFLDSDEKTSSYNLNLTPFDEEPFSVGQ